MIIDAHAHVWPDAIARQVLAARPVGLSPMADGTLDGLTRAMDVAGIDRSCCLGVATVAKNVFRTNEFIGSVDRSRFIPFGSIHPGITVEQNMKSLRDNGIVGVKFHPIFQKLSLSDPAVREVMWALAEAGIVVLTHAGAGGNAEENRNGAPSEVAALAEAIPSLRLIACHYGGYHLLDDAALLIGSRVFLETSWPPAVAGLDASRIRDIIQKHGAGRFVFGSDWPMADAAREIAALKALNLGEEAESALFGGTLAGLLGIASDEGEQG